MQLKFKKMKKTSLLLCLMLALVSGAFSQKNKSIERPDLPIDEDSKLVTYKEVVQETGTSQELYDRALLWVKKQYKNTNEVLHVQDREKGLIELRSSVRIYGTAKDGSKVFRNVVYYRCTLECRDQRYRYTITEFGQRLSAHSPIEVWFDTDNPKWEPAHYEYLKQIDEQVKALIASMKEGMAPKVEKVDEW